MTPNRRLAFGPLAAGLLVIAAAQTLAPQAGPPVYDGVMPLEPYRWAAPPPDHPGGAQGASATIKVRGGRSALLAVATAELSPQAQVFAVPGGLTLSDGTTSIKVSITPMAPTVDPPSGYIDGNLYRISVTDQAGDPITADASQRVSVVLRSADPSLADARIERLDGTTWQPLTTSPPDMPGGGFLAIVTEFGDFAVVASGVSPYPTTPASGRGSARPSAAVSPTTRATTPTQSAEASPQPALSTGSGPDPTAVVMGGGLVVVTAVFILLVSLRRRRRRRTPYRGARPLR